MRIGVDARELCGRPTGVGRHLEGLLSAWTQSGRAAAHSWLFYAPQPINATLPSNAAVRLVPGGGGTAWEQIALPRAVRRDAPDVLFAPGYSAPISLNVPVVLVVHDVSFARHPEWFRAREGLRRRALTRWSSRRAARVVTVSEASRREIIDVFGLPSPKVQRIYPGITNFAPRTSSGLRSPLVLFVGSIFNRRHLPDLIRGFKKASEARPDARLEIVGDNRSYPHQDLQGIVTAESLRERVAIRSYVSDIELADLYSRARVFAFLSEYEGFGHPPLEALSAGVPSVLLDTTVAREVCGDAGVFVQRGDTSGVGSALLSLLDDSAARSRVLAAAPDVLGRYSWPRAADETLEAIECAN